MGGTLRGYSPAEAALYWAADHAQPGAAVEVLMSPGERLEVRLSVPRGQQAAKALRSAVLHVNADDEGVTASPPAGGHLLVKLRRVGFAANDVAPLALDLPPEVALIIIAADGRLVHARPEPKALSVEVECPQPLTMPRTNPSHAHSQPAAA